MLFSDFTVPKLALSQSEAVTAVLIFLDTTLITLYGYDNMVTYPNFGTMNT